MSKFRIKLCPVCGSVSKIQIYAKGDLYYNIECTKCKHSNASLTFRSEEEAIEDWNNNRPIMVNILNKLKEDCELALEMNDAGVYAGLQLAIEEIEKCEFGEED